ncbi:MAG: hypothetical protein ACXVCY_02060 [Pseudobdellovibrionaceae bacterium]
MRYDEKFFLRTAKMAQRLDQFYQLSNELINSTIIREIEAG